MVKRKELEVSLFDRLLVGVLIFCVVSIPLLLIVHSLYEDEIEQDSYFVFFVLAMIMTVLLEKIYYSIHKKISSKAQKEHSYTSLNTGAHRIYGIGMMLYAIVMLLIYYYEIPGVEAPRSNMILALIAIISIIVLDALYRYNFMYLYSALLAPVFIVFHYLSMQGIFIFDGWKNIIFIILALPLPTLILIALYNVPIKVIKKHNNVINSDAQ